MAKKSVQPVINDSVTSTHPPVSGRPVRVTKLETAKRIPPVLEKHLGAADECHVAVGVALPPVLREGPPEDGTLWHYTFSLPVNR
jgi:hypothetical protein